MDPLFALKQVTFVKFNKLITGNGFTTTALDADNEQPKLGILIVTVYVPAPMLGNI